MAIRDPIHGVIPITRLEYEVTVTSLFERLRYIRKAGGAYLIYPGENDNRYAHSIGTCHIAYSILKNAFDHYLRKIDEKLWKDLWSPEYGVDDILQIVRLAGLLHDIGHGPFSHTTEDILHYVLRNFYSKDYEEFLSKGFGNVHEFFSYKMVLENKEIKEILGKYGLNPLDIAILFSKEEVSERKSLLTPVSINVLRKIISSQIDADRLDNLLRDSHAIGVPYGVIDVDSIVKNMFIYQSKQDDLKLVHHIRSLGSIEDLLDARYKMYRWLYYHQRVVLVDTILKRLILMLVEDGIIEPHHFHYSGYVRDDYFFADDYWLWRKIIEAYRDRPDDYYLAKTLINQDYLPLALWRTYEEFAEIVRRSIKTDSVSDIVKKVLRLRKEGILNDDQLSSLVAEKTKIPDIRLLMIWEKPTTPYDWRSGEEVLIYISPRRIVRMTEISIYIRKLIEVGEEYYPLYVYYYVYKKRRSHFIQYMYKVRSSFISILKQYLEMGEK